MPPDAAPELSVVIVNWNAGDLLRACLDSLREHPPSLQTEVVVVDNASSDASVERALAAFPDVSVIRNDANRGLAAANNQGIAATSGRYVLVSNPDVEFDEGAVDAMVDTMSRHERAGIVVPRLRSTDGSLQTSAGDLPTLREALLGRRAMRRASRTSGFWWDGWAHDTERLVGRGHECAYLVRRDAIADAGVQDERFVLDWEGIEWTARIRDAGWEVWFTPDASVLHHGGASIRQVQARWIVRSHLGMYRYFARRNRAVGTAVAPLIAARAAVKLGELVVRRDVYSRGDGRHEEATAR